MENMSCIFVCILYYIFFLIIHFVIFQIDLSSCISNLFLPSYEAVPVSQNSSLGLSSNSTPDLTELISMVKPVEEKQPPSVHMALGNQTHLSLENVIQLPSSVSETYPPTSGNLPPSVSLNSSQSVAVMAVQLPSMSM